MPAWPISATWDKTVFRPSVNCLTEHPESRGHDPSDWRAAQSADSSGPANDSAVVAPMEMHQIRYFLALSSELSFTRAAKRCGVSQPSLTSAINSLERQLGGALFRRKPRVALTALGSAMEPYLRQIGQTVDEARKTAQAITGLSRATSQTVLSRLHDPGSPPS